MLNKVIFVGHLGRDAEVRYTAGGEAVCNFSVASTEKWKDAGGSPQERTEWLSCVAWGKLGEICGEYLRKGQLVVVEGKLQTRKWEKDGATHYKTEAVLSSMRMLGGKGDGEGRDYGESRERSAARAPSPAPAPAVRQGGGSFDGMDDDIPF